MSDTAITLSLAAGALCAALWLVGVIKRGVWLVVGLVLLPWAFAAWIDAQ